MPAPPDRRYREIVPLARLVLDGRTALPTASVNAGASVLFAMTRIWEEYVGDRLRECFPDCAVSAQHPIELTDSGKPRTAKADFVIHQAGAPIAVFDAKYRPWPGEGPGTDEIYQLYTYARRLGIIRAGLMYPSPVERHASLTIDGVAIESYGVPVRQVNSGS
ncbi:hypothetical protein JIG36_41550 [Actinoplanes sp. LDG1-06]|uniref:Restriction endonuclease n=1 Tax=Paractinoplanes ovalisporus TaxID=2810368 RepID=A0ABS2AQJ4_9ACTN|nr:hypothetical protein [Actinoplanes ovalisporus]MBM2622008.1 hypothetical protein [Actinoplanes ovalisporus]